MICFFSHFFLKILEKFLYLILLETHTLLDKIKRKIRSLLSKMPVFNVHLYNISFEIQQSFCINQEQMIRATLLTM